MLRALFLALLFFVIPVLSAQEASPSTSTSPSGDASTSGSDVGAGNSSGGGTGASAPRAIPDHPGGRVKAPKAIYTLDPEYTQAARALGYQGTVVLGLVVDTDGNPKQIKVTHGLGMGLDEAAVAAVKKWRFEPAMKDGQPVPVTINVEVNFRTYGEPTHSLHPAAQASAKPPQFPGADLKKYPLVVYISEVVPIPVGEHIEIRATASVRAGDNSQDKHSRLVCEYNRGRCSTLWTGYYPARWIVPDQQLEIVGQKGNSTSWDTAQFTVSPATNP